MADGGGREGGGRREAGAGHRRAVARRRRAAAVASALVVVASVGVVIGTLRGGGSSLSVMVPRADALAKRDPFAYDSAQAASLERDAAFGLSHPLYAKSPGGVFAAARRTAAFRPLVEKAVIGSGFDADTVEAIVFLESGGRPDVIAGDDPAAAAGLTQILAETGKSFLGMNVDLTLSRGLTAKILEATKAGNAAEVERLRAVRRAADARFDPAQALAGTVRYLETALARLGRADLAVVSYHMGLGNLTNVLRAYANAGLEVPVRNLVKERDLSWVRVFFDSTPLRNAASYRLLARLGDDSPTYYWRILAAREIMRLYRDDPSRLGEIDALQRAKASAEEVLHPEATTERFLSPGDLRRARLDHVVQPLPNEPARLWFSVDPVMGELAAKLGQPEDIYRGLRVESLAALTYIAARVHEISGATRPLQVTSSVRDEEYQQLLRAGSPEATRGYSLHTTGYSFDIRRRYESPAQASAFQYVLDDLRVRGLIAWVREPSAIHITVSSTADVLVPSMLEPAPG